MMSLRQKIGQMLVIGFSGCEIDEQSPVVQWLKKDGLGGVILFDVDLPSNQQGKNLKNRHQIKRLTTQLKDHAAEAALDAACLPLLIAVDYEGGVVNRLSQIDDCIPTIKPCEQAQLSDDAFYQEATDMAQTLYELGFNLNFSPASKD